MRRLSWIVPVAGLLALQFTTAAPTGETGSDSVRKIVAKEFAFEPKQVTVEAGQTVTIHLENEGVLAHNLSIEQVGVRTETIQANGSDRVTFTPETPGEYLIHCAVPGHKEQGMTGRLVVR